MRLISAAGRLQYRNGIMYIIYVLHTVSKTVCQLTSEFRDVRALPAAGYYWAVRNSCV